MICSSVNLDFLIVRLLNDGLSIQMRDQTGLTSGWFFITAATVFFVARASIGTALIMGGLAIAMRLF